MPRTRFEVNITNPASKNNPNLKKKNYKQEFRKAYSAAIKNMPILKNPIKNVRI